jgi:hypothetical protein
MMLRCFELIQNTIKLGGIVDADYAKYLGRIAGANAMPLAICAYMKTKGGDA